MGTIGTTQHPVHCILIFCPVIVKRQIVQRNVRLTNLIRSGRFSLPEGQNTAMEFIMNDLAMESSAASRNVRKAGRIMDKSHFFSPSMGYFLSIVYPLIV